MSKDVETIEAELKEFNGSLSGYKEQIWPDIIFSEGIRYLILNTGFLDFMFLIVAYKTTSPNAQHWKFEADQRYGKAVFNMVAMDENGDGKEYYRQEYEETCFPLLNLEVVRVENVICLERED